MATKYNLLLISILTYFCIFTFCLEDRLEELQRYQYLHLSSIFKVSTGNKINITLPEIDSTGSSEALSIYQLSQSQYLQFENLQHNYHDIRVQNQKIREPSQQSIRNFKSKIKIAHKIVQQSPLDCQFKFPQLNLARMYSQVNKESPSIFQTVYEERLYTLLQSKGLLYVLLPNNMILEAYHVTQNKLSFLSSANLYSFSNINKISMGVGTQQKNLYIFTDRVIWQVQTKTILTNINQIPNLGGLSMIDTHGLDKILSLNDGRFVGLRKMSAVYIFSQNFGAQQLIFPINITQYKLNFNKLKPQDIAIVGNLLYILDLHTGVYTFRILTKNVEAEDFISFSSDGNNQLIVNHHNLFIVFNSGDGGKIVEIYYNENQQKAQLVRYYKNNDFIIEGNIFTVTQQQKYLFILGDENYLEIYPFNKDPRVINMLNNGLKMELNSLRHIFHVMHDNYLLITDTNIHYVKLRINKPRLICEAKPGFEGSYLVEVNNNISDCKINQTQKHRYNSYCQYQQNYLFDIKDLRRNELVTILIYFIVFICFIAFIVGLICLMNWRNHKIVVLQRLRQEIDKFRHRARRMQPFIQQEQKSQQVVLQVPRIEMHQQIFELPQDKPTKFYQKDEKSSKQQDQEDMEIQIPKLEQQDEQQHQEKIKDVDEVNQPQKGNRQILEEINNSQ